MEPNLPEPPKIGLRLPPDATARRVVPPKPPVWEAKLRELVKAQKDEIHSVRERIDALSRRMEAGAGMGRAAGGGGSLRQEIGDALGRLNALLEEVRRSVRTRKPMVIYQPSAPAQAANKDEPRPELKPEEMGEALRPMAETLAFVSAKIETLSRQAPVDLRPIEHSLEKLKDRVLELQIAREPGPVDIRGPVEVKGPVDVRGPVEAKGLDEVQTTLRSVSEKTNALAEVQAALRSVQEKAEALAEVPSTLRSVSEKADSLGEVRETLRTLQLRLDGVQGRLDAVQGRVEQLPLQIPRPEPVDLDPVRSALAALSSRLDRIESGQREPRPVSGIDGLERNVETVLSRVEELPGRSDVDLGPVHESLNSIGSLVESVLTRLDTQPSVPEWVGSELGAMRGEMELVRDRVVTLEQTVYGVYQWIVYLAQTQRLIGQQLGLEFPEVEGSGGEAGKGERIEDRG